MRFSILANAAFASSALAIPSLASAIAPRQESACLTRAEAKDIVDIYVQLIANYTDEVCAKYCASDFVDRSDSINTFIFTPLGEPTFATKEIFMAAQNANPPFPVVVDSIDAVDCEAVALRWHATFGAANLPSKGITIIGTTKREGYAQIKSLDLEFNSLIWLLNMGGNYTWEG
ncbi:hypothetical protein SMACR_04630 [Sordaria macrospora]|uniref:WGS project CABT00000000 data, contig 2.20 n=2 Tax=Sordaria macrospora TaxID=5147 RepID=F7W211_SORMK|nr:uncharacterized protein SMAC_04630 [Sordaria macrospora k-hell]KAA8636063.1 hypothetical protein SMACR_04630 [Sordaria macrospora]KAH7634790.1 hypothetical protein B0T09DRAFT_254197 [Sordaria sp. MPI-SDFR-AT-0083]WPJ58433.1 hypothetical protein SMAC4_04630 [Sordaria macrospora]CCC11648.1 unnamed protein product [Sordaria macrospora k-hell]